MVASFVSILEQTVGYVRKTIGKRGEKLARIFVKKQGMKILEKNYRAIRGEIDIIAEDNGQLVFIEVKTNTAANEISPELRVNHAKQRQIGKIAQMYMQVTGKSGMDSRFDVIGITLHPDERHEINHIRNAFWL